MNDQSKSFNFEALNWLNNSITKKGSLKDSYVNNDLNHQYHLAWLIYCNVKKFGYLKALSDLNLEGLIAYQVSLPYSVVKNSSSFIAIPILLTIRELPDCKSKAILKNWIKDKDLEPSILNTKRANNFFLMKCVALTLKKEVFGYLKDDDTTFIETVVGEKIDEWQLDDGFFFDKPFSPNERVVVHLTYHATISMLTAWLGVLRDEKELIAKANRAFKGLRQISASDGECCYFGRSNNALFGYGSAIFGISLVIEATANRELDSYKTKLIDYVNRNFWLDTHFNIVPNLKDNVRWGYDKYMFQSVYNAWYLGMIFMSEKE